MKLDEKMIKKLSSNLSTPLFYTHSKKGTKTKAVKVDNSRSKAFGS